MAATFAAVFLALYVGHQVGDYWVQTSAQARDKSLPGSAGRWACTRHVVGLSATKFVLLASIVVVLDLDLALVSVLVGMMLDAVTHWWADRRHTLQRLADGLGLSRFYRLGSTGPVHLGTGAHALDQSFHLFWLFVASLIIAA